MEGRARPVARGRHRFFSWYRAVPLAIVAILGAISFVYSYGPSFLFSALYPLEYEEYITDSCSRHGVDPYLVAAVINTESNWDEDVESSKGAIGLMQLMPESADDMAEWGLVDSSVYDPDDLTDPQTNIEYGCAFLAYLIDYYNGSSDKAVAAYNAGMGNVDEWLEDGGVLHNVITFPETQAYLARVTMAQTRYEELYPDSFQ